MQSLLIKLVKCDINQAAHWQSMSQLAAVKNQLQKTHSTTKAAIRMSLAFTVAVRTDQKCRCVWNQDG